MLKNCILNFSNVDVQRRAKAECKFHAKTVTMVIFQMYPIHCSTRL